MRKMRARVIKKFTSAEGMTILVALLFFMMCAVVGSIILTAATAASGRLSSLREEEKGYYAASSVAEYLKDSIEGTTFEIRQKDGEEAQYLVNGQSVVTYSDVLVNLLLKANPDADMTYRMTVNPSDTSSTAADGQNTVDAEIKMRHSDDYQITAVITTDNYTLTLVLPSQVAVQTIVEPQSGSGGESVTGGSAGDEGTAESVTTITTVNWSGARITASA